MNSGKEFKFTWNQYIVRESKSLKEISKDMRRAVGHAIGDWEEEEIETPPEEKEQTTALVVKAKEELEKASGPEGVTTALQKIKSALEKIKGANPTTALATIGKQKAKEAGTFFGNLLLAGKSSEVQQFLETIQIKPSRIDALLQFVTNYRQDDPSYYAFDTATLTEEMDEGKFLSVTSKRIGLLFAQKSMPYAFQKFIVAQGIVAYWQTVIDSNPQGLEESQLVNAQKIGEFVIKSLQDMISSVDPDAEKKEADNKIAQIAGPPGQQKQLTAGRWPPKVTQAAEALMKARDLKQFGEIYTKIYKSNEQVMRANQAFTWEDIMKEYASATAQNLVEVAKAVSNFGRKTEPSIRRKFFDLATEDLENRSTSASPEDVAKLQQKFHQGPREGKKYLSEQKQNQRWTQLAGIK